MGAPPILRFHFFLAVIISGLFITADLNAQIKFRKCPPFFLRTETGDIINPVTGQNADKVMSTRATCGAAGCHDYDKITRGFHFQQGWEKISDSFNKDKPWILSDGMMGKM